MRYLKLFESFEDIDGICRNYNIRGYTINNDGSIDVKGVVNFYNKNLTKLPLRFNKVKGDFWCSYNRLTSLEGSPVEVDECFICAANELTSFQYVPKIIRGSLDCRWNNIKSFEYFPRYIGEDDDEYGRHSLYCDDNPIYEIWKLFEDTTKIELLNDFDIFRDEDTNEPSIVMDRLNDFLLTIGKRNKKGYSYKRATELIKSYKII